MSVSPYDQSRYMGTVCHVRPTNVEVNLPLAISPGGSTFAGFSVPSGQVGEFVVIEGEAQAILGRVIEVRLPERERLTVEPTADVSIKANPLGVVQLLTAIDLETGVAIKGIPIFPRIGQHVFSAHPRVIKQAVEPGDRDDERNVRLAVFPHAHGTSVSLPAAHIFGRHCAVLGATGGGKSWTVAHLVSEIARLGGKAILLDATGEYVGQDPAIEHVYLGGRAVTAEDRRNFVSFPYTQFSETDLFAMFRPSASSQVPKLREALRSLKLAHLVPALANGGLVRKAEQQKRPFEAALIAHGTTIAELGAEFAIGRLAEQIEEECVFQTGRQPGTWGGVAQNDLGYCSTLISRIASDVTAQHLACVFQPLSFNEPLSTSIDRFMGNGEKRILRVSLEFLPFEHNARELVTNAIGRHLLRMARQNRFRACPLVVLLDEAHQFLDKNIGDEFSKTSLDAFGLIAKEGRKYFLTCVLATQRPRDIPEDVLSQMGMFIVHRLINERDRNVVEKACGNLDSAAASFLPTLGQGEAIVVGIDSPMSLPVLIRTPMLRPHSTGADYSRLWIPVQFAE
ncbi:MAG: ATP-binding protein [Pseudomonadota bacterium]